MNILFRADSSSKIGTGHIMRDLALAKKYQNSNIYFALRELSGNINYKVTQAEYKLEIINGDEVNELDELIKKLHIDLLIIDHYDIDESSERELKERNKNLKITVLDDLYQKHYCDTLINHNIYADEQKYTGLVPQGCELKCGSKYTILRDEFLQEKQKPRNKNGKQKSIFVAMGGADTANLNIKILKTIKKFKNIKVNLVTTKANKNLEELIEYCNHKKWIKLYIDSDKIAKIMRKSDFAVVTPSVTLNEIYFMELAFIAIKVAKNQDEMYKYLQKSGYFVLDKFIPSKFEKMLKLLFKSNGVVFKNFIDLTDNEADMVLNWRNSKDIRSWMYNHQEIALDTHLRFIESLKKDTSKYYFLLKKAKEYIGVADFTNVTFKQADIGVYKNPSLKRIGDTLISAIINYGFMALGFDTLYAEVFKDNERAYKLYKKHGFKRIEKKIVNNRIVYRMELKK